MDKVSCKHVKVLIDNTTAVFCINQMGICHSEKFNCIVIEIWEWCIQQVWLTAAYIPGAVNIIADQESRKISSDLEWALDLKIYKEAVKLCDFTPNIDLFASNLNKKGKITFPTTQIQVHKQSMLSPYSRLGWTSMPFLHSV